MSFLANKHWYLTFIRQFLMQAIGVEEFVTSFMDAWRHDRDESYAVAETWPERFDLQLIEKFQSGELSSDEFSVQWESLWGYQGESAFLNLVDATFSACSDYTTDPELLSIGAPRYFDAESLRNYLAQRFEEYRQIVSDNSEGTDQVDSDND